MKSPFPGMDPYLENTWRNVHASLRVYSADALQPQIRPSLVARIDQCALNELSDEEPESAGYIQILDLAKNSRPITVIKFLTAENKSSPDGIEKYRRVLGEALEAKVSMVEIDLLRSGQWVLQIPKASVRPELRQRYRVCIRRSWVPEKIEFYPLSIRDRLPKICIPLRKDEPDAILDLQNLIDQAYKNGAHDTTNYSRPLVPPLDPETALWAKERIANRENR